MPYNVDRIVNEIRNYNRTVNAMRSEFEAWKNEIQQQMTELKLMIERIAPISYPASQDAFLRETMGLVDDPEDSDETLDHKRLLTKRYHSQLNRFTQVTCTSLSNKLLADAHIDKNKLSWKDIPALKNKQPKAASNLVEPNTYVTEQIDDAHPEENLDFELLPDLDASNEVEEGYSNELNIATSSTTFSSSAVSSLLPASSRRTRSGTRPTSRRQNKTRRV
ncbi:hypothetical protein RO3G_17224 [Rhizopus delemar RA 99-880]|uniref:Uncharacterized protein n=1 Tax=Rhizopus delemar (strain RA 99-880 / ATCC MYA-4621 / FGSC 9543 / NRRL 43880) TaxID=246409 RepID=I1CV73_RHIO9|nr:hypothetical protein RO3G_17224 [Rhizopus delemar RA 99-880]|eukprot:EIE92353.1 hypothetical protein RO3G_17224 [Rhizopus delemar RA 99-880]